MIRDAFLWLLSSFVMEPAMGEVNRRLTEVGAPQALVRQVQACGLEAPAALAEKAAGDIWWGVSTLVAVAIGMTDAKSVLAEATPGCAAAIAMVRPLLSGGAAS